MVIITVVAATLLVCIGALLGAAGTARVLQARLDLRASQQAMERRVLNREWAAIHRQRDECPRCTNPLPEWDKLAPTIVPD